MDDEMKFDLMDVKVGDELYDSGIRSDRRNGRNESFYEVTKVARKYITAVGKGEYNQEVQIDRETGRLKADWNSHVFYRSKDDYITLLRRRRKICVALNSAFVGYSKNLFEGVPIADVLEAMRLLQIPYTDDGVYVDKIAV